LQSKGIKLFPAVSKSIDHVLAEQLERISMPRRITGMVKDIWFLQYHLPRRHGRRAYRVFFHKRFRAAYDFLLLRAQAGEKEMPALAAWWTDFQEVDEDGKRDMVADLPPVKTRSKSSRKRR